MRKIRPIPENRGEFKKNELPICQRDIRALSQVHGEEVAESVRFAVQVVHLHGGINPGAVETVFPEGRDGWLDEDALFRIVGNLATWTEIELS